MGISIIYYIAILMNNQVIISHFVGRDDRGFKGAYYNVIY